jgi:methylenetetrahydrofolate reductase (NADPH)
MQLARVYSDSSPAISFELFPPKTEQGDQSLMAHVQELMRYDPRFITCTYGAGGSTRDRTLQIVRAVKNCFHVPVASHLTCVGADADSLRTYLREAEQHEIDFIVALRGDPPKGESAFVPVANGFAHANELVSLIRGEFPRFGIAVAGYPEVHQEAPSAEMDLVHLKHKVDCGADVVITQLFYRNEDFFDFCRRARAVGIHAPIVPGILPVTNLHQIQRIASLCKAVLPPEFLRQLQEHDDPDGQMEVGIEFAAAQVRELLDHGVPGIHFYVLNKSHATCRVLERLRTLSQ